MNEFVNYGMKEIKPSFKDRVNNFIVMHPIIVALVIMFVISLMFGGCQRAKAQGVPAYVKDYSDQVLLPYLISQAQIDIYNDCLQNYQYFVVLKDTSQYFSDGSYLFIFSSQQFLIFPNGYPSGTYNYSGIPTRNGTKGWGSIGTTGSYTSADLVVFSQTKNNNAIKNIFKVNYSFSSGSSSRFSTGYTITNLFGSYSAGSYDALISTTDYTLTSFIGNGTFYTRGNFSLTATDLYSSIYDDNFEIYKTFGNGGINDPILHIGYSQLSSSGYPYNSYTSYTLTFEVDGSRIPVTVTSNGSYSEYFVDTSLNAPMEFIYRLLNNGMFNFATSNSVKLVSVSMSATFYPTTDFTVGTPETYTKSTLCNLILKGSSGSVIDYTPPETVHPNFIQVTQQTYFDNRSGFISSGTTYDVPQWADEVKIAYVEDFFSSNFATVENYLNENYDYVVFGNTLSSLVFQETLTAEQEQNFYDLSTLAYDLLSTAASYFNITLSNSSGSYQSVSWDSITPTMQRTIYSAFAKQINLDYILQSSDVISLDCIALIGADASNQISQLSYDSRSKYFTTRYFTRLNTFALGNVQYAIEANSAIAQNTYDLLYAYLDHMDRELLDSLGLNNSYLQSVNTLLNSMLDALGRILDALADLHLDQLDTIDAKLTTIISNMGQSGGGGSVSVPDEDDTIEEAIKYYLLCEDGIGVERAIFEDKFSVWFTGKWHLWLQGKKANGTAPEDNHFFIIGESVELVTNAYDFLTSEPYFWRLFSSWFDSLAGNDNGGEFNEYLTTFGKGYYNPDHYNGINE